MAIKVFLADDQELVRTGFGMVIGSQPDMEVVGEVANGAEAVRGFRATAADVVIMDVRMPQMDGIAATTAIAELRGNGDLPRVLVLTTFDLDEYAFAALRAGAAGFLLKDTPPEDLLSAIRTVHAGDSVISPSTTRRLVEHFVAEVPTTDTSSAWQLGELTEREREVLKEVASGLSNSEIAKKLYVSEATVKTHIGRLLSKTGLRDRVALVVLAYQAGIVKPVTG